MTAQGSDALLLWAALGAAALNLVLIIVLLLRRPQRPDDVASRGELQAVVGQAVGQQQERLERGLRQEMGESARSGRQELAQVLGGRIAAAAEPDQ